MEDNLPSVYLIQKEASRGDAELSTLQLLFKDGKPTLLWIVTWRGDESHASGAGDYLTIPPDLLPALTADSLTDWMLHTVRESVLELADFSAFAHDQRTIAWCDAVRKRYAPAEE